MTHDYKECLEKFCYKGQTMVNGCGYCKTPLLPLSIISQMIHLFPNMKKMDKLTNGSCAVFGVFVPDNEETAKLFDHRIVIYPVCHNCKNLVGTQKFMETVEYNIAISRRKGVVLKTK
jgi:hypothetical protein